MIEKCPECQSADIYFSKKKNLWICEDCGCNFKDNRNNNHTVHYEDLLSDEYWCAKIWETAPRSLAFSYKQLYKYVKNQNIGCVLFLIRDVFELIIKIPVTIIFNGIYESINNKDDFTEIQSKNPRLFRLYEYSMQMLSTGKWWDCVRLISGIGEEDILRMSSDECDIGLYTDTVSLLKLLYKGLYFRLPNSRTVNMVTWRNRTLGHSCLADNPAEQYTEIPYILKMFCLIGEDIAGYYQKVCLTSKDKIPLRGIKAVETAKEVFIQYSDNKSGKILYTKIHNFVAGRNNSLSYFDGYEKGKAYLLDYGNGERYKEQQLSELLLRCHEQLMKKNVQLFLSEDDVFSDNLETGDIRRLEEKLSNKDEVIAISFLGKWIMHLSDNFKKGLFLLTAERGLGKSTFCSLLNPFERLEIKYDDERYREELEEFLNVAAVRVWHFNSEYRSRKDIFISGIRDILLTLQPESGNRICGKLESRYNNLAVCPKELISIYFTECLNDTLKEYQSHTEKQKLLLIFDGIDEAADFGEIYSFMPDISNLDDDIFILLTCRTKDEIKDNKSLSNFIDNTEFGSCLQFTRNTVTGTAEKEWQSENSEYRAAVEQYAETILCEQGKEASGKKKAELAEKFEYRFSSLAAYKKLCRISPVFNDNYGANLFEKFMHQIEISVPDNYVHRLKRIMNTFVYAGEPITLKELAFLSGERYISYGLIGMMNDIGAFIKVTRSARGNCYELSHAQWKEEIKKIIPYGKFYFRKQCNELIYEMGESFNDDNIHFILEDTYEGELWLLKHILEIYNHNYKELKENWFEDIRVGSVEKILILLLQNSSFIDKVKKSYLGTDDDSFKIMTLNIAKDYFSAVSNFDYDSTGERGYKYCEKHKKVFQIGCLLEKLYSDIQQDKIWIYPPSVIFSMSYDAANMLSTYIEVAEDDEVEKLRDTSLRYLDKAEENSSYQTNGIEYLNVLLLIAKLRKGQKCEKGYEYAKAALSKIINLSNKISLSDTRERIILARAYAILGTVYYYEKNKSELEMYFEAYSILSNLSGIMSSQEYLKLKRWVTHLIGDTYNDLNKPDEAIKYWIQSLETAKKLSKNATARNQKTLCLNIGNALLDTDKPDEAKEYLEYSYEVCCEYDFDKKDVLESLITAYKSTGDYKKAEQYQMIYDPLIEKNAKYADAYQEVLEILKYTEKGAVEKIPESHLNVYKQFQNPKHGFKVDFSKPFEEQNIMEETQAILANIFRDYWANNYQNERICEHEERDRMENRYLLVKELSELINPYIADMDFNDKNYSKACNEVFWILEYIPQIISKKIPVEIIMAIKNNREIRYYIDFSVSGNNNYTKETIEIFSFIINKYVPDFNKLIEIYKAQIPEKFDLSNIFE